MKSKKNGEVEAIKVKKDILKSTLKKKRGQRKVL
jgi:hypothetical protein